MVYAAARIVGRSAIGSGNARNRMLWCASYSAMVSRALWRELMLRLQLQYSAPPSPVAQQHSPRRQNIAANYNSMWHVTMCNLVATNILGMRTNCIINTSSTTQCRNRHRHIPRPRHIHRKHHQLRQQQQRRRPRRQQQNSNTVLDTTTTPWWGNHRSPPPPPPRPAALGASTHRGRVAPPSPMDWLAHCP